MIKLLFKTMPRSTNNLYATFRGHRILTKKGRENKEGISLEARSQYLGTPLTGPLKVSVELWWPTKRNHDIDNIKTLLDSLSGIVYEDDGQIVDLHLKKGYDKENPRVVLTLEELLDKALLEKE